MVEAFYLTTFVPALVCDVIRSTRNAT